MPRASKSGQIGSAGEKKVCGAFDLIGWGAVINPPLHDLGTDLFVQARDDRLFDSGLVVGVQVKTGESAASESGTFDEPIKNDEGAVTGWWFRDTDGSHLNTWATHGLPHLLVLHDLQSGNSYWVHVTPDKIVATGTGAKIAVPIENTVDDEHLGDLLSVAASLRVGVALEGSAWADAGRLVQPDLLRHAFIVPRLVAPHPNAGQDAALTPEQAAALLSQARINDYDSFARSQSHVPDLNKAHKSPDWSWRFIGALGRWLIDDDTAPLLLAVKDAPDPIACAAAAVAAASALLAETRPDEAVALLETTLRAGDAEPIDHAWLTVQHARACAEIGRLEEARADAASAVSIRTFAPHDVTATAIAGTAAVLLFNTANWGERDVRSVISSADTAAAWWRAQTTARGLEAIVDRTFKAWTRDTSVTIGGPDVANNQLLAASLVAGYVGDQGGWGHLFGLVGRNRLMRLDRSAELEQAREAMAALLHAGDEAAIKLATRHLVSNGPAAAVRLAAAEIRLELGTRSTAAGNLMLIQHGGDVLDEETAERSVAWLLDILKDTSAFVARTTPSYLVELRLVETLVGVAPAAHADDQRRIVDFLIDLPAQDQLLAAHWAQMINVLPRDVWTEEIARRIERQADEHDPALRLPLLGVLARYDNAAREQLMAEAHQGSLDALAELGDVQKLSPKVVVALISGLARQVEQQIGDAHGGGYGFGGHDIGKALALLNAWHPEQAQWDPLLRLLSDPAVATGHKQGALHTLATLASVVPDEIRARLRPIAVKVAKQPGPVSSPFEAEHDALGAGTYLSAALGSLDADEAADRLLDLLVGDSHHRRWAAHVANRLRRPEDIGLLATLTLDPAPEVRAAASEGLASLIAGEQGGALAADALHRCARDPGTWVPAHVAAALALAETRGSTADEILEELRGHISAEVRAQAQRTRNG
jgi:hypothetical protein